MGKIMSGLNAGELTELLQLEIANETTGEGGAGDVVFVSAEKAWAKITPMREKLETRTGGRANGQHFKVLVYEQAFAAVSVRDQLIWTTDANQVLRIDVVTKRPRADNTLELEVYMDS